MKPPTTGEEGDEIFVNILLISSKSNFVNVHSDHTWHHAHSPATDGADGEPVEVHRDVFVILVEVLSKLDWIELLSLNQDF